MLYEVITLAAIGGVQADLDRAEMAKREPGGDRLGPVGQHDHHPVAGADAFGQQAAGDPLRQIMRHAIGQAGTVHEIHEDPVRIAPGPVGKRATEGPA